MNPTLDKLAHRAGITVNAESAKFAELIVRECIQVLKDTGYPNAHGNCVGVEEIKQHFGVDLK